MVWLLGFTLHHQVVGRVSDTVVAQHHAYIPMVNPWTIQLSIPAALIATYSRMQPLLHRNQDYIY
eukprot:scaffold488546_cov20-Prasinocladus_malaysianus.AAC.1